MSEEKKGRGHLSPSFVTGAVALAFLAIGYQSALFIHRAAALKILSDTTVPDTVFVVGDGSCREAYSSEELPVRGGVSPVRNSPAEASTPGLPAKTSGRIVARRPGIIPPEAESVASALIPRTYESFHFNPNTVSLTDLCRLGFSRKQAESIVRYREKGGRFRRKSDFARSFVVSDTIYARLEQFIDIPLLDINIADSADFDALPGIGGYFAARMVEYRERLGGYSYKGQLTDIRNLDEARLSEFADLICVGTSEPFRLWSLPADSLRLHPYIGDWRTAKAVVLYRENNPRSRWTVQGLADAGVLDRNSASRLSRCRIAEP